MASSQSFATWQSPGHVARARLALIQATPPIQKLAQIRRFWRLDDFTDTRWSDTPFPCDLCEQTGLGALRYRWVDRRDASRALWVDRQCALRYFSFLEANTRESRREVLESYTRKFQLQHLVSHCAEACLQGELSADEQNQWQRAVARRFRVSRPLPVRDLEIIWDALLAWCGIEPPEDEPLTRNEIERITQALCSRPMVDRSVPRGRSW